ncbi:MAG: hypothetical protein HQ498_05375 [Pseudohongiella sp.]|nr:hypothetical protein [Pseudohongiella sp.]
MHEFIGSWQIVWLSTWPTNQVNLKEAGLFTFFEGQSGKFQFGTHQGSMDVRVSTREPRLEFSWLGESDGKKSFGRGWLEFETPDEGAGMLFIHGGKEVGLELRRKT